jgi:hypothetical protein
MKAYCLDTSLLINGWNKYYRIDLFPHIWEVIGELVGNGRARIPWEVAKEIKKQHDELTEWMIQHKDVIVRPRAEEIELMRTLMSQYPNIAAQGGSTNAADPWVIVLAQALGAVVVTDENPQSVAKETKPPKITFLCDQLGIPWMRPIDFLADVMPPGRKSP